MHLGPCELQKGLALRVGLESYFFWTLDNQTVLPQICFHMPNTSPRPPPTTVKPNWIKERKQLCPRVNWKYYTCFDHFFYQGQSTCHFEKNSSLMQSEICILRGLFHRLFVRSIRYFRKNYYLQICKLKLCQKQDYTVSSSPNKQSSLFS